MRTTAGPRPREPAGPSFASGRGGQRPPPRGTSPPLRETTSASSRPGRRRPTPRRRRHEGRSRATRGAPGRTTSWPVMGVQCPGSATTARKPGMRRDSLRWDQDRTDECEVRLRFSLNNGQGSSAWADLSRMCPKKLVGQSSSLSAVFSSGYLMLWRATVRPAAQSRVGPRSGAMRTSLSAPSAWAGRGRGCGPGLRPWGPGATVFLMPGRSMVPSRVRPIRRPGALPLPRPGRTGRRGGRVRRGYAGSLAQRNRHFALATPEISVIGRAIPHAASTRAGADRRSPAAPPV
jgi:hypothetical protein